MQENTIPTDPQEEGEEALHHAGDKGFKAAMKVKETALEYMQKFYPKLYAHLDTSIFEIDNTNYIAKDFKEYYSDVVYRTYLKKQSHKRKKHVAVVLLFEHKKGIKSYFILFLQLLEYIVYIWKEDLANKRKPSVIIPIVVFQGKKGLKTKQLHDCFKGVPQEILKHIPNFEYHLTAVQDLPNEQVLALEEKGLLRSLFLAYNYVEKKDSIKDILIEIFKFFPNQEERFDFFQLMFEFVSKEDYLSADEIAELFGHYLSPKQKNNMETTYQVWKREGRQEGLQEGMSKGEIKKARSMVLRGIWKGLSADLLADQSELPYAEVVNLFKGYDKVYQFWLSNKNSRDKLPVVAHLSKEEVIYLLNLFDKEQ